MTLQTLEQVQIKTSMGLMIGCRIKWRFNWRFWKPVDCMGDKVYFGIYVEVYNKGE